jgi:hypothetical protein
MGTPLPMSPAQLNGLLFNVDVPNVSATPPFTHLSADLTTFSSQPPLNFDIPNINAAPPSEMPLPMPSATVPVNLNISNALLVPPSTPSAVPLPVPQATDVGPVPSVVPVIIPPNFFGAAPGGLYLLCGPFPFTFSYPSPVANQVAQDTSTSPRALSPGLESVDVPSGRTRTASSRTGTSKHSKSAKRSNASYPRQPSRRGRTSSTKTSAEPIYDRTNEPPQIPDPPGLDKFMNDVKDEFCILSLTTEFPFLECHFKKKVCREALLTIVHRHELGNPRIFTRCAR